MISLVIVASDIFTLPLVFAINFVVPEPFCTNILPFLTIKSSSLSSHNIYDPVVAPNNFTSYPVSSTPTVNEPFKDKVEPSKVRFASAFIASSPVAVNIRLFAPFAMKSETSTENVVDTKSNPLPGL